jgi:hypothetical protein
MRTQPFGIIVFILSAALSASGQPTGIQRTGVIGLLRAEGKIPVGPGLLVEETTDNATGAFVVSDYTNYTPPTLPPSTMIGPCYVSSITLPLTPQPPTGLVTTFLDAGPVINLNGPNGTKQIPQQMSSAYFLKVGGGVPLPTPIPLPGFEVLPPYLDPGTYTIDNGSGGADVGPFTATLTVPSPGFVWTNADANTTIALSAGIDIQWTGGDPTTTVYIQGVSSTSTIGGSFSCVVPNNGEFVVTSDVLASMPATPAGAPPGTSTLTVSNATMANFSAPGIDLGIFSYEAGGTRFVVYQ